MNECLSAQVYPQAEAGALLRRTPAVAVPRRAMYAHMLGPLTVQKGLSRTPSDTRETPTSNKEKQLLALLLINCPHVTSTDTIIDELWPEGAPRSAMTTLQTYVVHLRQLITKVTGESAAAVSNQYLVHRAPGYVLGTSHVMRDVDRYRELEGRAHRSMEKQEYELVVSTCEAALELWRGGALMDVRAGPHVHAEVEGLERSRLSLIESRIEANIELGRYREVLGELSKMVILHPLHEGLNRDYMRALARSGYRTRALTVYRALRESMVDQLGLEPSLDLRHLHDALLTETETETGTGTGTGAPLDVLNAPVAVPTRLIG